MQEVVNQHHIPRFFLRGFSVCINPGASKKRRNFFSYVCKRDGTPRFVDTKEIAIEKSFYESSSARTNAAEIRLSKIESKHASTLNKILREKRIHKSQWGKLSDMALQFAFRTKNFQYQANDASDVALSNAFEELPMQKHKIIKDGVTKLYQQKFNRNPTHQEIKRLAPLMSMGLDQVVLPYVNKRMESFDMGPAIQDSVVKTIVNNTLEQKHRYKNYCWTLYSENPELLLGDVCVMAYSLKTQSYEPAFFVSNSDTDHIALPISSTEYICGYDSNIGMTKPAPGSNLLNTVSAKLSREFVLAKSKGPLDKRTMSMIGTSGNTWILRK